MWPLRSSAAFSPISTELGFGKRSLPLPILFPLCYSREVQARFLLGPAGSGKTYRCLAEIRAALKAAPEGDPLILLAPKQATFQLERQLLSDPALPGYARLRILSFERLAEFILNELGCSCPPLLAEEGRLMVLRALLARRRDRLNLFHASARLPGLARQLSVTLRELQHHKLGPERLVRLAERLPGTRRLDAKLRDLALLLEAYLEWLNAHHTSDADSLLDLAAQALRTLPREGQPPRGALCAGLWLDGFAEMTPQELDLVAAFLPCCGQATLAFCRDAESPHESPLASGYQVEWTFRELVERVSGKAEITAVPQVLSRRAEGGRFAPDSVLGRLERFWASPPASVPISDHAAPGQAGPERSLRLVACQNPEAEAVQAAREILRFVRDSGARFRDVAVTARSLEGYHDALRRAFMHYGIPFFLDRRESVAHHPLAELTRFALRTVLFGWQPQDWFGALKTGLVERDEDAIDLLENEALSRGWRGATWLAPLSTPDQPEIANRLEPVRLRIIAPFIALARALGVPRAEEGDAGGRSAFASSAHPSGKQLAEGLQAFWRKLGVEETITGWSGPIAAGSPVAPPEAHAAIHATVWEQMNLWSENVSLAFQDECLPLREWLPILEAGLANLTVGVIPPSLDQVLVGTVDRSRNPDLKMAVVVGFNETVFPAPSPVSPILTETDRATLADAGVELGPDRRRHIGRERYYGYIACTRARERLLLTYSLRDGSDKALSPSPFVDHLRRLFPTLEVETAPSVPDWAEIEHEAELIGPLARSGAPGFSATATSLAERLPQVGEILGRLPRMPSAGPSEALSSAVAEQLHGPAVLRTSVSRIENFAACPFKFFVESGLKAQERKRFEVDSRQRGSFQHEVLARFHAEKKPGKGEWRDLTPAEARETIGRIAAETAIEYGQGLFQSDDQNLFSARSLSLALQDFIEVTVDWMRSAYQFEPRVVEVAFNNPGGALPAWELDLGEGHGLLFRGIIDRVDLAIDPRTGVAECVVVDYKSGARRIDPLLLAHGIQIQLPAYLAVLRQLPDPMKAFGVTRLVPAGVFYASLRGDYRRSENRNHGIASAAQTRRDAYQHRGRFNVEALPRLDRLYNQGQSGQFSYYKAGQPHKSYKDPMPGAEFEALLDQIEETLRALGKRVFSGVAAVDPYARGPDEKACDRCDFASVCRIDPWTHSFRNLTGTGAGE